MTTDALQQWLLHAETAWKHDQQWLVVEIAEAAALLTHQRDALTACRAEQARLQEPELSCLMCGFAKERSTYSETKGCFICVDCVYQHHEYLNMVNLAAAERGRAIQAEAQVATLTAALDSLKSELEFMTPTKFAARSARAETLRAETLTAALRRLIEKWRKKVAAGEEPTDRLIGYENCANEVDAVLRAASEGAP